MRLSSSVVHINENDGAHKTHFMGLKNKFLMSFNLFVYTEKKYEVNWEKNVYILYMNYEFLYSKKQHIIKHCSDSSIKTYALIWHTFNINKYYFSLANGAFFQRNVHFSNEETSHKLEVKCFCRKIINRTAIVYNLTNSTGSNDEKLKVFKY